MERFKEFRGSEVYATHSRPTWSDEGDRLLPAHFYFELTTQMREFERAFSQSVEEFLEVYPSYIEQVRPELNGLFREGTIHRLKSYGQSSG